MDVKKPLYNIGDQVTLKVAPFLQDKIGTIKDSLTNNKRQWYRVTLEGWTVLVDETEIAKINQ